MFVYRLRSTRKQQRVRDPSSGPWRDDQALCAVAERTSRIAGQQLECAECLDCALDGVVDGSPVAPRRSNARPDVRSCHSLLQREDTPDGRTDVTEERIRSEQRPEMHCAESSSLASISRAQQTAAAEALAWVGPGPHKRGDRLSREPRSRARYRRVSGAGGPAPHPGPASRAQPAAPRQATRARADGRERGRGRHVNLASGTKTSSKLSPPWVTRCP